MRKLDWKRQALLRVGLAALTGVALVNVAPASASSSAIPGTAWTVLQSWPPSEVGPVYNVSCPTASECVAVSSTDNTTYVLMTTNGGETWTIPVSYADQNTSNSWSFFSLTSASCPTAADCMVVGYGDPAEQDGDPTDPSFTGQQRTTPEWGT